MLLSEKDFKECDCPCHEPGMVIMHFVPCCALCPNCNKNIRAPEVHRSLIENHIKDCGKNV